MAPKSSQGTKIFHIRDSSFHRTASLLRVPDKGALGSCGSSSGTQSSYDTTDRHGKGTAFNPAAAAEPSAFKGGPPAHCCWGKNSAGDSARDCMRSAGNSHQITRSNARASKKGNICPLSGTQLRRIPLCKTLSIADLSTFSTVGLRPTVIASPFFVQRYVEWIVLQ